MRYLFGFLSLFALGLVLLMQCGEADLCEGIDCSDSNECTQDVCNPVDGHCTNTALSEGTDCDLDGDPGQCMVGVCVGLCEGVDCGDGNPCTDDVCSAADGSCNHPHAADGTACQFGEHSGQCSSGLCVGLCEGVECDDHNPCTEDVCNLADGSCLNDHRPDGAQCDFDGIPGVCRSGVCQEAELCRDLDCSDDNDCTDDVCDPATGLCSNPNKVDGADCEIDGNPGRCTDARCVGLCEGVDCSDGNECTIDQCDPSNGSCFNPTKVDGSDCEIDGNAGQCSAGQCVVVCEDVEAIGILSPLADERFVKGETVSFIAVLTSDYPCDGSELTWTSSLDGPLGTGPRISVKMLSIGTHRVTVAGYGVTATRQVRIYSDLGTFLQAAPAEGEIGRIRSDFEINKISTTGVDEDWTAYEGLIFDQSSTDPNELVIIAKLDVLRHQRFAEPLPFTGGATIYEHLTKYVHTLNLYLDCRYNTGGGGQMFFSRNISVWGARFGGTPEDPDACKEPFPNNPLMPYPSPLQLIVHEGRHSEPDDPRHTTCAGLSVPGDATLEGGSGYAQGALYSMWVYKYGLYDPPDIKEYAKSLARTLLGRICSLPTHSNPLVQAIVDELLEGYPPSAISKSQRGDPYLEDYACGVGSLEVQP